MEEAFIEADVDGDGSISLNELNSILVRLAIKSYGKIFPEIVNVLIVELEDIIPRQYVKGKL